MSEYRHGPSRGMFNPGRGGRGQMMPRFTGPGGRNFGVGLGGPSPYFPGHPEAGHWGCPVRPPQPPPQFSQGFRCRGPSPLGWRGPPPMHFHPRNQNNSPRQKGNWQNQSLNHGNPRKNKKPVVDKRELPEKNEFFCDICDRGFKSGDLLKVHIDSHEKCKEDGCSYTAAPKLVQLHYKLQHKTGLAKKIWQLESKADLEKWREQRKKNFPTVANVAKKSEEMADKLSRGEVLQTKSFGKFKNNKFLKGRGGKNVNRNNQNPPTNGSPQKRSHDQRGCEKDKQSLKKTKVSDTPKSEELSKPPELDPLSYLLGDMTGTGSDDESEAVAADITPGDLPDLPAGGLGNLISSYASDSGEEDVQVISTPLPNTGDNTTQNINSRKKRKRGRKNGGRGKPVENHNLSHQSTLLEKLLAPEIRHERNVILQCIRYIVKKDFFGLRCPEKQESLAEGRSLCITKEVDEEIWENGHVTETATDGS